MAPPLATHCPHHTGMYVNMLGYMYCSTEPSCQYYKYLVTQGHTHQRKPTNQTSKHSSQLPSHPLLSTCHRLPDVSLVPKEVCLHGPLSWHRPRLPPSRIAACRSRITARSTWHRLLHRRLTTNSANWFTCAGTSRDQRVSQRRLIIDMYTHSWRVGY